MPPPNLPGIQTARFRTLYSYRAHLLRHESYDPELRVGKVWAGRSENQGRLRRFCVFLPGRFRGVGGAQDLLVVKGLSKGPLQRSSGVGGGRDPKHSCFFPFFEGLLGRYREELLGGPCPGTLAPFGPLSKQIQRE